MMVAGSELARNVQRDGWALVKAAVSPQECHALREAIAGCRASPGPHFRTLSPKGAPSMESELFRWHDTPTIGRVATKGALPRLAAAALGTSEVILLEDQWFFSDAGSGTKSPWHQDHPYHPLEPWFLTIWVPLDQPKGPVGLRTVTGSHFGPIFAPVEFSAQQATLGAAEFSREPVPDIDTELGRFDVAIPEASIGDAVLIDSRTLHAAGGQCDDVFRRISIRYAHPATRIVPRAWSVAEFWDGYAFSKTSGAALPRNHFPILRPLEG